MYSNISSWQAGASPHVTDKKLRTPLMRATKRCHSQVAIILVQRGSICDCSVRRDVTVKLCMCIRHPACVL